MRRHAITGTYVLYEHVFSCQPFMPRYAHAVGGKRAGFIAGGPRRVRGEDEGFLAFLLGWVASFFRVDRRM
jgi:hypothetical protein